MAKTPNRWSYGLGTFGRDAAYTLVTMYLMYYLTDIVRISRTELVGITVIMVLARIFDAVSDPFVGVLIDNTNTKWGKFKPWMAGGALASSIFLILLFTHWGISGGIFLTYFAVIYVLWGITYTANDVGYWSMLPALSREQEKREKIGAFARICANLGAFTMVVSLVPASDALTQATGSGLKAFSILAIVTSCILLIFQSVTLFSVKEDPTISEKKEQTRFRDIYKIIFKNDQLLAVAVAMTCYTVANTTTINLGLYYFKYVYGDEDKYSIFALILGIAQISTLAIYPKLQAKVTRKQVYSLAIVLVAIGYTVFFFAPSGNMVIIGIGGLLLFVGGALVQVLMLMFITDSVEYGQWKLGARNESVTLSVQPFIYKVGGALATGVAGLTVLLTNIQSVPDGQTLQGSSVWIFKTFMMVAPTALLAVSYLIYRRFYRIDQAFYDQIINDLKRREEQA